MLHNNLTSQPARATQREPSEWSHKKDACNCARGGKTMSKKNYLIILRPCAVTISQTARRVCPRPCPCPCRCPCPGVLRVPLFHLVLLQQKQQQQQQHENCHISKSLLTSGLWLQQLMESFPPARLAHSFGSTNQLAVPADHSIKSSFHFVLASTFFFIFLLPLQLGRSTPHCACGNFFQVLP